MKDYIVLDVETTGFDSLTCELLEIGAWKIQEGKAVSKFVELIKPRKLIPKESTAVNHITADMVRGCRDVSEVLPEFFEYIGDLPLLGHNLPFDYKFICVKGKACGCDFTLNGKRTGIDTLALSRSFYPELGHKLYQMMEHFGIKADEGSLHRAEYDAYMCKLIYDRFLYLYKGVSAVEIPQVLDKNDNKYGVVTNNAVLPCE